MKRTLLAVVLLSSSLGSLAKAESPVEIPDPGLKAAIEDELWVTDPTPTDMLGLTYLVALYRQIADLKGLEYAANLQVLGLRDNQISDLTPLAGLTHLESLNLSMNQIRDLTPLAGLHSLKTLDVHDNPMIEDLSPVATLASLETFIIRFDSASDISALADLHHLKHLDLSGNRISNLSPVAELTSLAYLDVRYNPLSRDGCEVYIPQIEANNPGITLAHDQCDDFFQPQTISISSTAGGSVAAPGEGDFIFRNGDIFWLTAVADPGFAFRDWSGGLVGSANPASLLVSGDRQVRAHFVSTRTDIYVGDDASGNPREDGSPAHPFRRIQDAIEVAADGVSVVVRPGTYRESVNFLGKRIHLLAVDPEDPHGGPCVAIEGPGDGPIVTIPAGSGSDCSLHGFLITRGQGRDVAAIHCDGSSPTIANCLIVGNRCDRPGGTALWFENSRAVLSQCTIADNDGGEQGAGVTFANSSVTILNSILWGNRPEEVLTRGAGNPLIRYCCIRGGWPGDGNIDTDPLPARRGSWVNPDHPKDAVRAEDPLAVWVDGDYHVKSQAGRWDPLTGAWVYDGTTSPCIDAGERTDPVGYEPAPNGGVANLGAYGGTSEASRSHSDTSSP